MKSIKSKLNFALAFIIALSMVISPFTASASNTTQTDAQQVKEEVSDIAAINKAIDQASENILQNGVRSEWGAIGLAQAGKQVPHEYEMILSQSIQSQITDILDKNGRLTITNAERLALGAAAIGKDPGNIVGHNLIEIIYNIDDQIMIAQGNNALIYGLLAFDTQNFAVPEDANWTRERLIGHLLDEQLEGGGWSLFGSSASYDITAMALIALGKYKDNPEVNHAINRAITFLSEAQSDAGGFDDRWNGGISSETTAQVIIGLVSTGNDPTDEVFTKSSGNLIDHLLSFAHDDGGFKHLQSNPNSNAMATEQALQALVAYKMYLNGEGHIYQFSKKDSIPMTPIEPVEPEKPEKPDESVDEEDDNQDTGNSENEDDTDHGSDESDESDESEGSDEANEQEIVIDGKVNVKGDQTIKIANTKTTVKVLSELPEGTTLKVTKPETNIIEKTFNNNIKLAGDLFTFDFDFVTKPENQSYKLTMAINKGIDPNKAKIFYYNEQEQVWELVKGKQIINQDGTISVNVSHFSTYGVFVIKDESHLEPGGGENDQTPEIVEPPVESTNEKDVNENTESTEENDSTDSDEIAVSDDDPSHKLPSTATNTFNILMIGLLLMVSGGVLAAIGFKASRNN